MTTDYKINGSAASIAPISVKWIAPTTGISLSGRGIYSAFHNIELQFDGGSIPECRQWLDVVSAGSFNVTLLSRDQLAFTTLSGVNAEITEWPSVESVNYTPFSITIRGAL
jgi:hypothetical protein